MGHIELGGNLIGPGGEKTTEGFVRSMFSGEPAPDVWESVAQEIRSTPRGRAYRCCSTTVPRTGATCCPASTCPPSSSAARAATCNPDSQRCIAEKIPGAQLHVFPPDVATSHCPFPENLPAFDAVVDTFLSAP